MDKVILLENLKLVEDAIENNKESLFGYLVKENAKKEYAKFVCNNYRELKTIYLNLAIFITEEDERYQSFDKIDSNRLSGAIMFAWHERLGLDDVNKRVFDKIATDIIIGLTKRLEKKLNSK